VIEIVQNRSALRGDTSVLEHVAMFASVPVPLIGCSTPGLGGSPGERSAAAELSAKLNRHHAPATPPPAITPPRANLSPPHHAFRRHEIRPHPNSKSPLYEPALCRISRCQTHCAMPAAHGGGTITASSLAQTTFHEPDCWSDLRLQMRRPKVPARSGGMTMACNSGSPTSSDGSREHARSGRG
jgi:hypothetical protein